jgi:hypothetical protein
MPTVYFERRISAARGSDSVAADIMRHLHARQHLGKATIICEHPVITLSAARKQWLKLARHAQKQRASTLNADKILKYTHTITRMQNMRFTLKSAREKPDGDVFFVAPSDCTHIAHFSQSAYIIPALTDEQVDALTSHMGDDGLIVDYAHNADWKAHGLKPKKVLEAEVTRQWSRIQELLAAYDIKPQLLNRGGVQDIDAMDDALDTLLNISRSFMLAASDFHHALEVARPLRTTKDARQQFDAVMLLAHRVQALSTGSFTQRFLEIYNEDDTFYLYDNRRREIYGNHETIEMAIERHRHARRTTLASALEQAVRSRKSLFFRSDVL